MYYYAQKDALGYPTPGTMQGYKDIQCNSNLILIPCTPLSSEGACKHPNGLRYWYGLKKGKVIPNSLKSSYVKPAPCFVEFFKH